jgi:hypothetical protein
MVLIHDEAAALRAYETLAVLHGSAAADHAPEALPLFDDFLTTMKRALINPGSREAAALLRGVAMFENISGRPIADPDLHK